MFADCNKRVPSPFCKLQVGVKLPFRETAMWPRGPWKQRGATATPAATAASFPSAKVRSPRTPLPVARPQGFTRGIGVKNVSLALLKEKEFASKY